MKGLEKVILMSIDIIIMDTYYTKIISFPIALKQHLASLTEWKGRIQDEK